MPELVKRLARRAGLRPRAGDPDAELRFWLETWEPEIRAGSLFDADVLSLIGEAEAAPDYEGRRWQIARAIVLRVLKEAQIGDSSFFDGKAVVDIGPGPVGFPDACPARVSIAIEPLATRLAEHDLLLRSDAVYLDAPAERTPLLSESVDVVVARNSLDHVADPAAVAGEVERILRPGGIFILNVDVGHQPTAEEPHSFETDHVRRLVAGFEQVHEQLLSYSHGIEGKAFVSVVKKPQA